MGEFVIVPVAKQIVFTICLRTPEVFMSEANLLY